MQPGSRPHDAVPDANGYVWYTGQANGTVGRLDPSTGDLFQMDHSPSGDFSPTMDSYGRVLVMRWDRLQRDRNAETGFSKRFVRSGKSILCETGS